MQEIKTADGFKRVIRRRPVPEWKLIDSINYIRMRDKYLQDNGILTRTGKRRWRLKLR